MQSSSPEPHRLQRRSEYHFLAPGDFATIYDLPASLTGAGTTIGIVAEARTDIADFHQLQKPHRFNICATRLK